MPADYDADSHEWNGLSGFIQLASEIKVPLLLRQHLILQDIEPGSGILLLAPQGELPRRNLANFMREGGRVGLLDDQGTGEYLLQAFHIRRQALTVAAETPMLRGNPELAIALPSSDHPLTYGVAALVTNHPQVLVHPHLEPVLTVDPDGQALALSGAVGEGRLVAVADASILINNMLAYNGNRHFAQNLLRYLSGEQQGPVYLVVGSGAVSASHKALRQQDPIARVRKRLQQMIAHPLPRQAVLSAAWIIAIGLLLAAAAALPRPATGQPQARAEKAPGTTFSAHPPRVSPPAATSARKRPAPPWASALSDYRREWQAALARKLSLPHNAQGETQLLSALARSQPRIARRAERLIRQVDHNLQRGSVSARKFRLLVRAGQSILRRVDP